MLDTQALQHIGGLWNYTDEVEEEDLLGRDPGRRRVHSSMYADLRTNLPREVNLFSVIPGSFRGERIGPERRRHS